MFINGEPVDYNGERTEEAIYDWIMSKDEASTQEVTSLEELETFSKNKLAVLLVLNAD